MDDAEFGTDVLASDEEHPKNYHVELAINSYDEATKALKLLKSFLNISNGSAKLRSNISA